MQLPSLPEALRQMLLLNLGDVIVKAKSKKFQRWYNATFCLVLAQKELQEVANQFDISSKPRLIYSKRCVCTGKASCTILINILKTITNLITGIK